MSHKKLFLLWLFVGMCFCVLGQGTGQVFGTVRDAETNETLIGVSVYVEALKKGTTTDEKGRYELALPAGKHLLHVSYIGYTAQEKTVSVGDKPLALNLKLVPETEMLSEVEVTSKRKDRNVSEMAMSVQTLDMITIKKIPALMGEVDVIKSIQLLPGVQAASEGSSGFSVRGGGTDQNLIFNRTPINEQILVNR